MGIFDDDQKPIGFKLTLAFILAVVAVTAWASCQSAEDRDDRRHRPDPKPSAVSR